jgi:hypothetical protein
VLDYYQSASENLKGMTNEKLKEKKKGRGVKAKIIVSQAASTFLCEAEVWVSKKTWKDYSSCRDEI